MGKWKEACFMGKGKRNNNKRNITFMVGLIDLEAMALFAGGEYNQCAV